MSGDSILSCEAATLLKHQLGATGEGRKPPSVSLLRPYAQFSIVKKHREYSAKISFRKTKFAWFFSQNANGLPRRSINMHQQFCFAVSKSLQNFNRTPSRAAQMSSIFKNRGMASSRSKKLKPASALFLSLCFCVAAIFSAFESLAFAKNILVTGAGGRTGILVVGELLDASTCKSCNHVMSNRTIGLMNVNDQGQNIYCALGHAFQHVRHHTWLAVYYNGKVRNFSERDRQRTGC